MNLKSTRVLLADDDAEFTDGLLALLDMESDIEVIGVAMDGREVIIATKKHQPDIILMDVRMPEFDGLLATKFLSEISPQTRIIALSSLVDRTHVKAMLDAGATGYVAKSRAHIDVVTAINAANNEHFFMSPNIDGGVLRELG